MSTQWTKVTDRNPETSGDYLCCYHVGLGGIYAVWTYSKDLDGWNISHVSRENELFPEYWQELPSLPLREVQDV